MSRTPLPGVSNMICCAPHPHAKSALRLPPLNPCPAKHQWSSPVLYPLPHPNTCPVPSHTCPLTLTLTLTLTLPFPRCPSSGALQLAVLHPRKLTVYSLAAQVGQPAGWCFHGL